MFYDAIHAKTTKGFVSHLIKYSDHFKFEFGVVKFFLLVTLCRIFFGSQETSVGKLLGTVRLTYDFDFLLEWKKDSQDFRVYQPGGMMLFRDCCSF